MKIYSAAARRNFIREEVKKLEHSLGMPLRAIVYEAGKKSVFQVPALEKDDGASGIYFENEDGDDELYLVKVYSDEIGEIKHAFAAVAVVDGDDEAEQIEHTLLPIDEDPRDEAARLAGEWLARQQKSPF
ncbi:MAG: hypothetical protein P1U36_10470 [Legionellaceae bacterium]|nr:hypothetical protein [Legionellaceae bacterium]